MASCLTDDALAAVLYGELPETERAQVEEHLGTCSRCHTRISAAASVPQTHFPAVLPSGDEERAAVVSINPSVAPGAELPYIGRRYQILNELGRGGMGAVYQAVDRLSGQPIALKCVSLPIRNVSAAEQSLQRNFFRSTARSVLPLPAAELAPVPTTAPVSITGIPSLNTPPIELAPPDTPLSVGQSSPVTGDDSGQEIILRLALAQEFKTLASLRHPHIVSVLDYGFDRSGAPFFTMELLTGARPLTAKVAGSFSERVALLLQMLQALTYLHRRGVLHRDIKAANALVVNLDGRPHVKLLDFGVSVLKQSTAPGEVAGTFGYIAPEVLRGEPVTEAADLYSFGVVACELLTGRPLHQDDSPDAWGSDLTYRDPVWHEELLPAPINEVLHRLLAGTAGERYASAEETASALAAASELPLRVESAAIRESFLQAATFIGRDTELKMLRKALGDTGSAWLVGGESGVGKSRLLDELRTWALVHGALVLRGQVNRDGDVGFGPFIEPLRTLSLEVPLEPLEASVIKSLVPDLPRLLDREVADAPQLDGQAARLRLLRVLETVLLRTARPTLLLLEDLQWAVGDSLELLKQLTTQLTERPLLIVGSYRQEERPELPALLPAARALPLPRLNRHAVRKLSASMLGASEASPAVVDLLWRETEGNTFFLVEVARALAEEAGSLAEIGRTAIPPQIFVGGVDTVLQRRIQRVPPAAQPLLRLAAVAGRQLDVQLLRAFDDHLDDWLQTCAAVAVLEMSEQQWRFCHDKLRERLLTELHPAEAQKIHREIAEALERTYPDTAPHARRLGYHYQQGGVPERAARYLVQAGELAVRSGALAEAELVLTQAQALQAQLAAPARERFHVKQLLVNALIGLAKMEEGASIFRETLATVHRDIPSGKLGMALVLLRKLGEQVRNRVHPRLIRRPTDPEELALFFELTNLHVVGAQLHVYRADALAGAYSILEALNLSEQHGGAVLRGMGYGSMAYLLSVTPLKSACHYYMDQAEALLPEFDGTTAALYVIRCSAMVYQGGGQQQRALRWLDRAQPLAEQLGDIHAHLHSFLMLTTARILLSEYPIAKQEAESLASHAASARNDYYSAMAQGLLGAVALRQGQLDEANEYLRHARRIAASQAGTLVQLYVDGLSLLCAMRRGEVQRALDDLPAVLGRVESTAMTSHNCLDGWPTVAEVCLLQWQRADTPEKKTRLAAQYARAMRTLGRYALSFPIGRPVLHLLRGRYQLALGNKESARRSFTESQRQARQMSMRHEAALAAAWHGKAVGGAVGRLETESALEQLRALGVEALPELDTVAQT